MLGNSATLRALQERAQETPMPDGKTGEKGHFSTRIRWLLIFSSITVTLNSLFRKQTVRS